MVVAPQSLQVYLTCNNTDAKQSRRQMANTGRTVLRHKNQGRSNVCIDWYLLPWCADCVRSEPGRQPDKQEQLESLKFTHSLPSATSTYLLLIFMTATMQHNACAICWWKVSITSIICRLRLFKQRVVCQVNCEHVTHGQLQARFFMC